MLEKYENVKKAFLLVAYDNGIINRFESEDEFIKNSEQEIISGYYDEDLNKFDKFLATLNEQELQTLCIGLYEDALILEQNCPHGGPDDKVLTAMLDDIY